MNNKTYREQEQKQGMTPSSEPNNLLSNIEKIIELSENSGLGDEFFENAKPYIDFVKNELQLSDMATVFFAFLVDNNDSNYTSINDLSEHFNCRKIRIMRYGESLQELEKKRLVRCHRGSGAIGYQVRKEVMFALNEGEKIEPRQYDNISQNTFFGYLNDLFTEKKDNEILYSDLVYELSALVNANPHLKLSQTIRKHDYAEHENILLLYICHLLVNDDDDLVGFFELASIFEKNCLSTIKLSLRKGYNRLLEDKWIENVRSDGFANANYYHLTENAKCELIGDDVCIKIADKLDRKFILHSTIIKKELFFDAYEQEQIDKLTDLLKPDNFAVIQKKFSDNGMRNGFACLFYGAPGTGKTETVYQIARQTGRNILPVNVSEIKSVWVGESEKSIKKLFDDYRESVSHSEVAPILLFNEADALLGTRMDTLHSVDKMENALQNIILQEMENLNGIMIATTNMTRNLDKAFKRRFIYKIEFLNPSLHTKKQIWRSMMSNLSESDADELALKYDFSGGQIENIVRKSVVEQVLNGGLPSLETLHGFCRNERFNQIDNRPRIGFQ
jgi:hypothetical protein